MTPLVAGSIQAGILGGGGASTPDVFGLYEAEDFIEENLLLDLAPAIKSAGVDLRQFQAGQLGFFTPPGGSIFGLPAEISTTCVLVSLDAVNRAGIATPANDWSQTEAVQFWTDLLANGGNAAYGTSVWGNQWGANGLPGEYMWQSYGASMGNGNFGTKSGLDTSAALSFANWFYPLVQKKVIAPASVSTTDAFNDGQLGTTTLGSWQLFWLVTQMTGVQNYDFWPNPVGPVGHSTTYAGHDFNGVSIATKHPNEAAEFLIWLATSQDWAESMIKLQLVIPPSSTYLERWVSGVRQVAPPLVTKNLTAFITALQAGKGYGYPYFLYDSDNAYQVIGNYTRTILTRATPAEEALSQAASAVALFEKAAAEVAANESATASQIKKAASSTSAYTFSPPSPIGIGTPYTQLPAGWWKMTGGGSSARYTMIAGGADVWSTSDNCTFAYEVSTSSEGTWTCEVTSLANLNGPVLSNWAKVGLMVRGDLSNDSAEVNLEITGGQGIVLANRQAPGDSCTQQAPSSSATTGLIGQANITNPLQPGTQNVLKAPLWLQLQRKGTTWTALTSTDGATFQHAGTVTLNIAGCYVGLFLTAHNDSFTPNAGWATAAFTEVSFTPTAAVQIGTAGPAGEGVKSSAG